MIFPSRRTECTVHDGMMNHTTSRDELGFAVVVLLILVGFLTWKPMVNAYEDWKLGRQLDQRAAIQYELTRDPNRVDPGSIVVEGGELYHTTPVQSDPWQCAFRCAVAVPDKGTYEVTLPIGYVYEPGEYQRTDNDESRWNVRPISKLTYWSPTRHQMVTVQAEAGKSVALPSELVERQVSEMKVSERGYVKLSGVTEISPNRGIVYNFESVAREPGDVMLDSPSTEPTLPIERTKDGFVVCVPKSGPLTYTPELKPDNDKLLPARLVRC